MKYRMIVTYRVVGMTYGSTLYYFLGSLIVYLSNYLYFFFFSSRRRHTRFDCDWSSDVCSSDLPKNETEFRPLGIPAVRDRVAQEVVRRLLNPIFEPLFHPSSYGFRHQRNCQDRKSVV